MKICKNCKWWVMDLNDPERGYCHRYPPNIEGVVKDNYRPKTHKADFCGEFEEKKI